MTVTSNVTGIYAYSGSVAGINLGGAILNTSLLNLGSGSQSGTFVDNNGLLSQADDGRTTFSLNGGAPVVVDYIGGGTISAISLLGLELDPRPVGVFAVNGQVYFYAPQGLPILSGLTFSLNISSTTAIILPAASNGQVDGYDSAQTMGVGFTDLQGDAITENADRIFANGGNDTVSAGGGNDTVYGGTGNDSISGGSGNDLLYGDAGNDTLLGGVGNDTLMVDSAGADQVNGEQDRDVIIVRDGRLSSGSVLDGGEGGDDFDTLDLRDAGPRRIVYDVNNPENGQIFWLDEQGAETGLSTSFSNIEKIICFTSGTRITTISGMKPIEDLKVGDLVLTFDHGFKPIRWIGSRQLSSREIHGNDLLRPVTIKAGALGSGLPERDLTVSRHHRILVKSTVAERMFGQREVLMPAKDLCGLDGVSTRSNVRPVEYWHMMFDDHEVVLSETAPTESFFFGPQARQMISAEAYEEITSLFPQIELVAGRLARDEARGHRARQFVKRITSNGKLLIETDLAESLEHLVSQGAPSGQVA